MEPRRKQGPLRSITGAPKASRPVPLIKTGSYVPLAILIVKSDKLENYHLPQKLFAIKDFDQGQVMRDYFFQHPQQPVALDPNKPNVGAFNSAVCNFSNWLVLNGYCEKRGTTDVIAHLWTPEEMEAHRKEQAELREAAVLAHAEQMAAAGEEGMVITEGINNLLGAAETVSSTAGKLYAEGSLDKLEHNEPVNVGTIGHVDHGINQMTKVIGKVLESPADESALAQLVSVGGADPYAEAGQRQPVIADKAAGHWEERIHPRELELDIISECTIDQGTDYPHLRGMNKEQLDAYFAANPGVETAAAAAVQVADAIAEVRDTVSLEEMEAKFSDADPEQVAARADRGDTPDDLELMYPNDAKLLEVRAEGIDAPADLVEPQSPDDDWLTRGSAKGKAE